MVLITWGDDTETVGAGHATRALKLRNEHAARTQSKAAYEQGGTDVWARAFGVTKSAISHRKNGDHKDPITQVCEGVMRVEDEEAARALLAAVEAAYERRALLRSETPVLLNQFVQLWYREHDLDSEEDKQAALYMAGRDGEGYDRALRRHGTALHLLAEIRDELEARGVDTRRVLVEANR